MNSEIHVSADERPRLVRTDARDPEGVSAVVEIPADLDESDVEQLLDDLSQEIHHTRRVVGSEGDA